MLSANGDEGVTIWGNVLYARSWGEYEQYFGFKAYNYKPSGLTIEQVCHDEYLFANGSGAFYNGKFHMISRNWTMLYCEYDMNTWEQLSQELHATKFAKLVATDCDYDPMTGLTYGCFWNDETKEYEFASVDYETLTHNTIAPMEIFSAIAINSKGVVYGIKESDGGLYTIDKTTGEQTFIGSTGVTPYLLQSAAFDRKNDILYWAVRSTGSVAYLATVNTDTGAVRRLAYLPDNEQISCLYIPFKPNEGAPGAINDFAILEKPGLKANVSFTIPSNTAQGASLGQDAVSYTIIANGNTVKEAQGRPGEKLSFDFDVKHGYNAFIAYVENDKGSSGNVERRAWCGADTPTSVSNVRLVVDTDNNNTASVSWSAPAGGIHNGAMDAGVFTYDVVRLPEEKLVASKTKATSLTDVLGKDRPGIVSYRITPYIENVSGEAAVSVTELAKGVYNVPYFEDFENGKAFEEYTVVDSNSDKTKWFWQPNLNMAEYLSNFMTGADDWMLTPEIHLEKGRIYELNYDYYVNSEYSPEILGVKVGRGVDPSTFKEILPDTQLKNEETKLQRIYFSVEEDGDYRVGFHCTSTANGRALLIDNISLKTGPAKDAPASVRGLSLIADATGSLLAEISFTTPLLCVDGKTQISSLEKIEVYRNDQLVKTFNTPKLGAKLSFEDEGMPTGNNRYRVIAFGPSSSAGVPAEIEAYIGQGVPGEPPSVTVVDNVTHHTVSWEQSGVGQDGYPVKVDELTYNIYVGWDRNVKATGIKGTTFDVTGEEVDGAQDMIPYFVAAETPAGIGNLTESNGIIVGKPYELPFRESFKNMAPSTYWWAGGYNVFRLTNVNSYDDDGGCLFWKSNGFDNESWFNTGKINLKSAKKPIVSFAYYALPKRNFKIYVYVSPQGAVDKEVGVIDFNTLDGEEGWRFVSFELGEDKVSDYSFVKFFTMNGESRDNEIIVYLDQISIRDGEGCNLAATRLSAPSTIFTNQTLPVDVKVENFGSVTAPYSVNLYADGVLVGTKECGEIEPLQAVVTSVDYSQPQCSAETVTLRAEVVCSGDKVEADNFTDECTVEISRPSYPVVDNLDAKGTDTEVSLTWSEPAQESVAVKESFEDYVHKDTRFGDWMTVDKECGQIYTVTTLDLGHGNMPLAYSIFNTIAACVPDEDAEYYAAQDGTTSLVAVASQPTTILYGERNDDWLISPELSACVPHTVSFWAKSTKGSKYGFETFEILSSKGYANALDEYQLLESHEAPEAWTKYTVQLPEGSRHFAVRYTGYDTFVFMLDSFEFETGIMEVLGYNLYRNGELIAELPATQTSYCDREVNDNVPCVYNVTVKYTNGESAFSNNAATSTWTGIDQVTYLPEGPFDVYTVTGIRIRHNVTTVNDLPRGIYIVNDRKVAIL